MAQKPIKILQASAGSGKTFSLTAHYLTLLFAGETRYREILAVTFTNKATEEMKSRILEVLRSLALGGEDVATFRKIILNAHPNLDAESLKLKANQIYRRILHDYSRFSVNTIDGFVQKVIRSLSFELGLDAGYKLEMNTAKVKEELANRLNKKLDSNPDLLEWIISLALDRIRDNKSWNFRDTLLGLAGEIFKERYQPFENALKGLDSKMLFKDLQAATREMVSVFEESITEKTKKAHTVFKQSGVELAELKKKSMNPLKNLEKIIDGDFTKVLSMAVLVDEPDEWQKGSLSAPVSSLYNQLNPVLKDLQDFYKAHLPTYEMARAIDANLYYLRLMQEMAGLLKDYRQENSALLISDAQNLLKGITGSHQDNPSFVWEKLGSRYRHFLFDEFQDTSAMQWENFLPLVSNAIAEANGDLIDHLIVGDVKQSIYRWRNGDWQILLERAKADIGSLRVLDDSLAENYRSAANVIDFNNFLFKHSPVMLQNHLNEKVRKEGGEELFNGWWQQNGLNEIIVKAYEQSLQQKSPVTASGGTIQINYLPVESNSHRDSQCKEQTLDHLAESINEWISTGRYTAGQICILVRSNKEARSVIEHLMKDQQNKQNMSPGTEWTPYQVLSGEALLLVNNSAVRLLINTLKAMVARRDQSALYKLNMLQLFSRHQQKTTKPEILLQLNQVPVENLKGHLPELLCANWLNWQQMPLTQLVELLIGAYGLETSEFHLPYLLAFRDMISNFSKLGEKGISSFLEWWDEESEQKALPSSGTGNAVQVITIHKSKGLAFDVVMVPFCSWDLDGMTNSIFWVETADTPYAMLNTAPVNYKKSLGQSAFAAAYFKELLFNYMDALNMLYVATTRTRKHLYISSPGYKPGKEEQFNLAGDLIRVPLETFVSELKAEFDGETLLIDEPVIKVSVGERREDVSNRFTSENWMFDSYPLSDRLNDALTDKKVFEQLDLLSGNSSQRRGIILHEVLARVNDIADLPSAFNQMHTEGFFRKTEEAELLELAQSVLSNPELKVLLDKPYTSFNEQTIISGAGESYRPDKVLIGIDQVVVIDFKFTGKPSQAHYKQVNDYRALLMEMGYQNIEAYLYYGFLKELVPVNATLQQAANL